MSLSRIWRSAWERLEAALVRSPLSDLNWTLIGVVVFSAAYLAAYASQEMLPGEHPMPTWEHWHDQGQYLRSARAFADGNLAASEHWYPPGYSLLAVPFVHLTPANPFVIPDFVCFILYFLGFMRLTREWLPPWAALFCFGLGTLYPPFLLCQYIYPWNTIPVAALLVWLLALINESLRDDRLRFDFAIGLLAGLVIAIRQIEMMAMIPAGAAYLYHRVVRRDVAGIAWAAIPCAILPLAVAFLIFEIHGTLATPYVIAADKIGFSLAGLVERATFLFLDASVYNEPDAAVRNFQPFVVAMLPACLAAGVLWRRRFGVPVAACLAALVLYLSYNDFSPINIVRFYLVHYIEWTFPIILAAGISGLVLLFRERRYVVAVPILASMAVILLLRVQLVVDSSWQVSRLSDTECAFALTTTQPGNIDAVGFISASTPREDALTAKADGTPLSYAKDYDVVHVNNGLRMILKRNLTVQTLQVFLPTPQNPHCSADLVRPQRSALRLALGSDAPQTHTVLAEAMYREIGYVKGEGKGATHVFAGADEEGWVAFGPRENLPEGHYVATFELTATGAAANDQDPDMYYDVVAQEGDSSRLKTLGSTTGRSSLSLQRIAIGFNVRTDDENLHYHYRIRKPRGYVVHFAAVEIARKDG